MTRPRASGIGRRRIAWTMAIAAALAAGVAHAQEAEVQPREHGHTYSPYEQDTLRSALSRMKAHLDDAPEGKVVESIEVIPLDVVEPRDPIPNVLHLPGILNFIHVRTQPYVIRREVLQRPGEAYKQALVDETCRNLRNLEQLSLVLCFPIAGSAGDRVRIAVVTKDVWSLRLGWNLRYANGKLEYLVLAPTETNLAGTHQSISATFQLDPAVYAIGGAYTIPRLAGSRIAASASASVVLNRETGANEGSFGSLAYGQPLYSTQAKWAWDGSFTWRKDIHRRFIGGSVAAFDALATPQKDSIPDRYHEDILAGEYGLVRSFGRTIKNDFRVAVYAQRDVYRTDDLSAFDPRAVASFLASEVPTSDTRVGPYLQWHGYSTRFVRVLDFNTLGLQEDFRLGHDVFVKIAPSTKQIVSSRDLVSIYGAAAYTVALGDGLLRGFVETLTEIELANAAQNTAEHISDGQISAGGRIITPTLPFGRLIFDAIVLDRYRNYLNHKQILGGDTRLRGYPTQAFTGRDLISTNLEFRTKPVEILTAQIGAAAFYDTGDAFNDFSHVCLKQGAGFGLRGLLPMLDRVVLRADWGFPLSNGKCYAPPTSGGFPGEIVVTFLQAFPMPVLPNAGQPTTSAPSKE